MCAVDWTIQIRLYDCCKKQKSLLLYGVRGLHLNLSSSYSTVNGRFPLEPQVVIVQDGLIPVKGRSPSWDISPLNQLWDLIDCADFLVGLCALKKWSPSFNALWIKQGRQVHSSRARLHNDSTFVANKRLTRKEWSDGRINLLEASPQFSHHFSCRMSSWIVTQKAKLSMRDGFLSYSMFREARGVKRFRYGACDKLCLGVKCRVCWNETAFTQAPRWQWCLNAWLRDWIF